MTSTQRGTASGLRPDAPGDRESSPPPILCLVGKSGAGKTQVAVALLSELKRRGYRVATIKHVGDHDFDIDRPGKDSWRYAEAGSDAVAISSPQRLAIIRKTDHDTAIEEIATALGPDWDLILAEGYKRNPGYKVEVRRRALGPGLLCKTEELLALISDERSDIPVPQYRFDDMVGFADLIEGRLLRRMDHD